MEFLHLGLKHQPANQAEKEQGDEKPGRETMKRAPEIHPIRQQMDDGNRGTDGLELKVLPDHQLREQAWPERVQARRLSLRRKESALGGESKKDGRTQPDRCI